MHQPQAGKGVIGQQKEIQAIRLTPVGTCGVSNARKLAQHIFQITNRTPDQCLNTLFPRGLDPVAVCLNLALKNARLDIAIFHGSRNAAIAQAAKFFLGTAARPAVFSIA
ncbi:MAG: hypothetical protein ACOY81_10385 [Bacillota bacterium]